MKLSGTLAVVASLLLLSGCVHKDQNTYGAGEVGHDAVVMYGIVKSARQVEVLRHNSGAGAAAGAVGGGLAGSAFGSGNGNIASIIGGALIGGIAGAVAEDAMQDHRGIEHIIKLSETGETRSVVQNIAKNEAPIAAGQCVMLQMSGKYQRVLKDEDPSDCPAPKKLKVKHARTKIKGREPETTIDRVDDGTQSSPAPHKHDDDEDDGRQ